MLSYYFYYYYCHHTCNVYFRSLCSLVCKWAYDAGKGSLTDHSWNDEFLTQIGLADLIDGQHHKLGHVVNAPGEVLSSHVVNVINNVYPIYKLYTKLVFPDLITSLSIDFYVV